jgi:hypothetical protein
VEAPDDVRDRLFHGEKESIACIFDVARGIVGRRERTYAEALRTTWHARTLAKPIGLVPAWDRVCGGL